MIKSIYVDDSSSIVFTGNNFGHLKLWDIRQQSVIQDIGDEIKKSKLHSNYSKMGKEQSSDFHSDSIWSILPSPSKKVFTGSKDGRVCEVDFINNRTRTMIETGTPITSISVDEANEVMWYGTYDSTI